MHQIATASSDIFVELSNNIKAWNIACVLDWLRVKQHQIIKASKLAVNQTGQSMEWLTIAVLTGSEKPCFLLLWVALNKSIADSSSPLRSSFWNVFQQKSKCYSARIRNVIQWGTKGKVSREEFSQWQKCVLCSLRVNVWSPSPCSSQNLPSKTTNKVGTILVIMHRCNRK